jgi:cysteine-rich repeat protein
VPARCGDGCIDSNEQCDEGADNSDDPGAACRASCLPAFCGDNIRDPQEACDEGTDNSDVEPGACRSTCVEASCGDNVLDPVERCDDGRANSDSDPGACRTSCIPAHCGDGVKDDDEACDDGGATSGDGCRDDCLKIEICGDGVVDSGEDCDDENDNPRDGCDRCLRQHWRVDLSVSGSTDGRVATGAVLTSPLGLAIDALGRVYVTETGPQHRVRRLNKDGTLTTIAGFGPLGPSGDGGPASAAMLQSPKGVAVDATGRIFIADQQNVRRVDLDGIIRSVRQTAFGNALVDLALDRRGQVYVTTSNVHTVRRINADGTLTTVAGTGVAGFSGDNGLATAAQLRGPLGIAVDPTVTNAVVLYVADSGNRRIRRIEVGGSITTVAGSGVSGGALGDGGPAVAAALTTPRDVTVDSHGELWVADAGDDRVRRFTRGGGITTVAGGGTSTDPGDGGPAIDVALSKPRGIVVDNDGVAYIAETGAHRLRRVRPDGIIDTVAGTGVTLSRGGPQTATSTPLQNLLGTHVDTQGRLFVADADKHCIRRIDADGTMTIVAGTGRAGFNGDGASARTTLLNAPQDVFVDPVGNVLIADTGNHRVRRIGVDGTMSTLVGGGSGYPCQTEGASCQELPGRGLFCAAGSAQPPSGAVECTDTTDGCDPGFTCVTTDAVTGTAFCLESCTVAGSAASGFAGDAGPASLALLNSPRGVTVDTEGQVFVVDTLNQRVRRIGVDGIITTVAGTGTAGFTGDNGAATSARLRNPHDVAVDATGTLFIADTSNHRIRRVTATGTISTVAGSGVAGFSGDNGAATIAQLNQPSGVAIDAQGAILVADRDNHRVRRFVVGGRITSFAGSGNTGAGGDGGDAVAAALESPVGVAVDADGRVAITQTVGRARLVDAGGTITSVLGAVHPPGPGPSDEAQLYPSHALVLLEPRTLLSIGDFGRVVRLNLDTDLIDVVAGYDAADPLVASRARFASLGDIFAGAFLPVTRDLIVTRAQGTLWRVDLDPDDDGVFGDAAVWTVTEVPTPLVEPAGVAVLADESLVVVDRAEHCVRAMSGDAVVSPVPLAGVCGTPGVFPGFLQAPTHVAVSPTTGALYIADTGNQRVLRVSDGVVDVVVGDGSVSSAGEGSPARRFPVQLPRQLALDAFGNLYVASSTTVRLVQNIDGDDDADGDDRVVTLFGGGARSTFPESDTSCVQALAIDDDAVYVSDSCQGYLAEITPVTQEPHSGGHLR